MKHINLFIVFGLLASVCGAAPVEITSPVTIGPLDVEITPSAGGPAVPLDQAEILVNGTMLTINGRHSVASLTLASGAVVRHDTLFTYDYDDGGNTTTVYGLSLTVLGDCLIPPDCAIDVSGRGYGSSDGPGQGGDYTTTGAGAGHGGRGGDAWPGIAGGAVYGTPFEPSELGSGGGQQSSSNGGSGGGVVRLVVQGTLSVDGRITADGTQLVGGGGSGGSVWITAGTLAGDGSITANGGDGRDWAAGGGGGRVAVYASSSSYSGVLEAFGGLRGPNTGSGSTQQSGAAGTIYTELDASLPGTILVDNNGTGTSAETDWNGPIEIPGHLHVRNAARISSKSDGFLELDVAGDVMIDAGAAIDVDGRGYGSSDGPGQGGDGPGRAGGAGHGGSGGSCQFGSPGGCGYGGWTYGSLEQPSERGSGGGRASSSQPGGFGGGAVRLYVGGVLSVEGNITANGAGPAGGGSGGSIWIDASRLQGTGLISARGGPAANQWSGSGGGGRIAVYTCDLAMDTNLLHVFPGSGGYSGNIGTIFLSESLSSGPCCVADFGLGDFVDMSACLTGPGGAQVTGCECFDFDQDNDTDLRDFAEFQTRFTGP